MNTKILTLNFWIFVVISFGLPISFPPKSTPELKYSSGVMWHGLPEDVNSSWSFSTVLITTLDQAQYYCCVITLKT